MSNKLKQTYPIEAVRIHARPARLTRLANARHPLDAHAIAYFHRRVVCPGAHFHNLAHALVAAYLARLGGEGQDGPCVHHYAHVRVADARVCSMNIVVLAWYVLVWVVWDGCNWSGRDWEGRSEGRKQVCVRIDEA